MARPKKNGLSYFPLDVDFDYDNKFQLLLLKHSAESIFPILLLFCNIYKEGYYYRYTEEEQILLAKRAKIRRDKLEKIVDSAILLGLFDKDIYEKYKVLTSKGIQERFFEASKRRKEIDIVEEYIIKSKANNRINIVNVTSCIATEKQDVTSCIATEEQDVVLGSIKKRKEKKRKEKYYVQLHNAAFSQSSSSADNDEKLSDEKNEIIKSITDKWNVFAIKHNLRTVKSLIGNGIKNIITRLDEPEFNFDKILEISEQSEFLLMHGEKGKPMSESFFTLQWIISDKRDDSGMLNYEKILDGNYKNQNKTNEIYHSPYDGGYAN